MRNSLSSMFAEMGRIIAVCPDEYCRHIFYLSEARPYLRGKQPKSIVDQLRATERTLDRMEEVLSEIEGALRERAAKAGLRTAKALLKKIDPVFSGAGYDPQDVKILFNPVTYVVFHGLANGNLRKVRLLSVPAADKATEQVHESIDATIRKGNYDFRVLRVDAQGAVSSE